MSEDLNVSIKSEDKTMDEDWRENWRMVRRNLLVKKCANGYMVEYAKSEEDVSGFNKIVRGEIRVFTTLSDMLDFVEKYFEREPNL